jgi:cation:H+ antiporter
VVGGGAGSEDVAVGAIVGAPFLLATVAFSLVAGSAYAFRSRRATGVEIAADLTTFRRDVAYFVLLFAAAVGLGLGAPEPLQLAGAVVLVAVYAVYAIQTVRSPGVVAEEQELETLYVDTSRGDPPNRLQIAGQLAIGLGLIVGGAHLFVEEVLHVAEQVGIAPLVLSLVLAPFATELPEKANSFLWIRQGKDALALGNITGAMVFQSALPVAIGLVFTDWRLRTPSLLAAGLAFAGAALAYLAIARRRRAGPLAILGWGLLYAVFVAYVVANS